MLAAEVGLVTVAVAFLVLQLAWVPRPFGLSTDEATYLAKVVPGVPELYWTAPRAWGMPILAAPVALLSAGLPEIRTYFALLASLLLVAAFRPWVRVLHPAVAVLAALVFSTTWFTMMFGSLTMPNLYVALGSVGAAGLLLRAAADPAWWRVALTGLAACLVALVRPTDSVLTLGPLFALALVVPRLRRPGPLVALGVGALAGWSPWIVEAFLRFGGPVQRLTDAETAGPGGVHLRLSNLLIFPRLLDGTPTYCCTGGRVAEAGPIPWTFTAWLLVMVGLAMIGVAVSARLHHLPEVLAAAVPATLVAAFYLLLPSFTTLRFLLPAFALASLPVAGAGIGGDRRAWPGPSRGHRAGRTRADRTPRPDAPAGQGHAADPGRVPCPGTPQRRGAPTDGAGPRLSRHRGRAAGDGVLPRVPRPGVLPHEACAGAGPERPAQRRPDRGPPSPPPGRGQLPRLLVGGARGRTRAPVEGVRPTRMSGVTT